jgi:hypothetical protein
MTSSRNASHDGESPHRHGYLRIDLEGIDLTDTALMPGPYRLEDTTVQAVLIRIAEILILI